MGLAEYRRKRDFTVTPEPRGRPEPRRSGRSFVVQKHAASRLHYDFRLELQGVLKSWAIPKGPSLDPAEKRLAMQTEDHPVEYGGFEGVIPEGEYGGGTVLVWDRGEWEPVGDPHQGLRRGSLEFRLFGGKLKGGFALVRVRSRDARERAQSWLLVKKKDAEARPGDSVTDREPLSVLTGRDLEAVARDRDRVWHSRGQTGAGARASEIPVEIAAVEDAEGHEAVERAVVRARVAAKTVRRGRPITGARLREVHAQARRLGLEGVVSERRDAAHAPARGQGGSETAVRPAAPPAPAASKRPRRSGAPALARGRARAGEAAVEIAGVRLTNPDRVVYPDLGLTKRALAEFYVRIADWILPQLAGRPTTLVRCPEGVQDDCFYQKHVRFWAPEVLRRVRIQEARKMGEYLVVDDLPGLVGLVQLGILEVHTWNSLADHLEQPDRIVFDLDPDPELPWERVTAAARRVRERLLELDLESYVKTTGSKGLHVVVPLQRGATWEESGGFAEAIAFEIAREEPAAFLAEMSKARRRGRIFIDYLRNRRGATSVSAYSTRARPLAPVSTPLRWAELADTPGSAAFTVETLPARLSASSADAWAGFDKVRQRLTASLLRTVGVV